MALKVGASAFLRARQAQPRSARPVMLDENILAALMDGQTRAPYDLALQLNTDVPSLEAALAGLVKRGMAILTPTGDVGLTEMGLKISRVVQTRNRG